jgi:hypothetical protein
VKLPARRLEGEHKLSWAPEAITDSGQWAGNRLRFDTKEEAETYLAAFSSVRNTRVVESYDPVNYRWDDGRLVKKSFGCAA